jgi:DNA-binding transcriptional ArsR family regulator
MDLARTLLKEIEEKAEHDDPGMMLEVAGYDEAAINHHLQLLADAGLIEVRRIGYATGPADYLAKGLTWQGHEFLAAARNDTVWTKAKGLMKQKGVEWSFELLKASLVFVAKQHLGLPTTIAE